MSAKRIDPAEHLRLIDAYATELPSYELYAGVLERLLERACVVSIPEASIQTRAKTVSSFAEKCARKYFRYRDCLRDMTDLCGARVIVQTQEQVEAVKQFIDANFHVVERDEKGLSLGEERFGYRDMHFIVQLDPGRAEVLDITAEELDRIADRRAEIQVRTWLQHAWADTLHDRMYKAPLRLSREIRRTGNLLAALMEEGDRNYDSVARELDGMIANYAAFADRAEVEAEIAVQRLILDHERDPEKRPSLALRLGRLLAANGDYAGVVKVLSPYQDVADANRCELLSDLGYALCKVHRDSPRSDDYRRGQVLLEAAVEECSAAQGAYVLHLRKHVSLLARGKARLAWALEVVPPTMPRERELKLYGQAHEHEPRNPYFLADMLGYEFYANRSLNLSDALRTQVRDAVAVCRSHAEHGIELPRAYFTAGRLYMLLKEPLEALGYYARGIGYTLAGTHCVPSDAIAVEREWIERLHVGVEPPDSHRWVMDLLDVAARLPAPTADGADTAMPRALIVAGGARSMPAAMLERCRPLLELALEPFHGTVVSGGTKVGVPGCVADVAEILEGRGARHFEIYGYVPKHLPHDAPLDPRYERYGRIVVDGESGFTPRQVLRSWQDLLSKGITPAQVLCLGFGGGKLSRVDYQIALALGALVVVALGSGGTADELARDPLWAGASNLLPLPMEEPTFQSLLAPPREFDAGTQEAMAREVHRRYVADNARRLPSNMRPWDKLDETFRKANREQARHAVRILETAGFVVKQATDPANPVVFDANDFTTGEIDHMAQLEHGRWNVERVRSGWRYGSQRDDARLIHDNIVRWADLPDAVKEYDRQAVREFPAIVAVAGLEVRRPQREPIVEITDQERSGSPAD